MTETMPRMECILFSTVLLTCAFARHEVPTETAFMYRGGVKRFDDRLERRAQAAAAAVGSESEEAIPSYMLDLYQRYTSGHLPDDGSNTVHCIQGERAARMEVDSNLLIFNMDTVSKDETVIRAELRFYRRGTAPTLLTSVYGMWSTGNRLTTAALEKISGEFSAMARGWHVTNITASVRRLAEKSSDKVSLGFGVANTNGSDELLQFLKHHSVPYILVYTNETVNLTVDQINARIRLREGSSMQEEASDLIDPEKGLSETFLTNRLPTQRRKSYLPRRRRDIYDNEIPTDPDIGSVQQEQHIPKKLMLTSPEILTPSSERRRPKNKSRGRLQVIPWPQGYKKNPQSRNSFKTKNEGRIRQSKAWWQTDVVSKAENLCGKRRLVLDFKDIGWGEWIIEPKSFEAHYCAGECTFPYTMGLQPTNHATIQSLLKAAGVRSDVPAPCCVPDKLSSVTLLYYDQKRNVVLKNYPGMTVESCACR